jgi:prepilin-type N-terminal cleavage/methylation domain-containing protein
MRPSRTRIRRGQSGFSLLEMMIATIILLVGLVAVAQLVPASILLNYRNRTDSSALIFAQRELDQMLDQPLSSTSFTDALLNTCKLGNPTPTNSVQGTSVVAGLNGQPLIDFTSAVSGYNFNYPDPTDPNGTTYDVRWAVIVTGSGGSVSSKRFILGVRKLGGNGYFQPVTLDTMVVK